MINSARMVRANTDNSLIVVHLLKHVYERQLLRKAPRN